MTVNSMGGETELDLATYTFSGNAKRGLRYVAVTFAVDVGVALMLLWVSPSC
jgi:lysylphosphatidylglycerol synthetase-like protein (DUF2156 family)